MSQKIEDFWEDDDTYILTDRTTAETDDRCGMRRWWYKHEGGIGIVPVQEAIALRVGRDVHEDLATLATLEDISVPKIKDLIEELRHANDTPGLSLSEREVLYRRLGWLAAYAIFVEPRVRAEYETIGVEEEHILDRSPLWISYTPDRYLRHREGRYLVYREYKSTISASTKWLASWAFAPQIHIGIAGMQEELGEKVAFGQVMGLMKGDTREGRLNHPYVWGWYNSSTSEWTHEYSKARTAAWTKMPIWEFPGGTVEWVLKCGEDVAKGQFPHTPPIFYNERLLNDWVTRRTAREIEVAEVVEECRVDWNKRVMYFEPRTAQCRPPFGDSCPYLLPCHNAAVRENPLACSDFKQRVPHHATEVCMLEGTDL